MARQRDYKAEYARRVERARSAGKSNSEAIGKPQRDYHREYARRVAREVAAGRRAAPAARPRSNTAPTGASLQGARRWDGDDAADRAESFLNRLRSDRRVFVYARLYRSDSGPVDVQLFPNGGVRAGTLRQLIATSGTLEDLIFAEYDSGRGPRLRIGDNPAVNPSNRRGRSGKAVDDSPAGSGGDGEPADFDLTIEYVVLQWTT